MAQRNKIFITFDFSHEAILERWKWFRQQLINNYNIQDLPESFTNEEGNIHVHHPADETFGPVDFNYYWRSQTLIFQQEELNVTVVIHEDELGDYYSFKYEGENSSYIYLYISENTQYLQFNLDSLNTDKWIKASEELNEN